MANAPTPLQVGGLVPNVWFDLFGRIIPAAYLLLGILIATWTTPTVVCLSGYVETHPVTGLPIVFLVFMGSSYMVGWLLGIASYWLVEFPVSSYRICQAKKQKKELMPSGIREIIVKHCGPNWSEGLDGEAENRKARDHCTYLIWHIDPVLAVLFGRWDAESLGARSTVIASGILICFYWHSSHLVLFVLLLVAVLSGEAYRYHSNRALKSRFDMVLALKSSIEGPSAK